MATLDPFAGNHAGQMSIYVYSWINAYVGSGSFTTFSSFEADFSGQYNYLGFSGNISVSLVLTDQDPDATSGPCTVTLLGNTDSNATYQVNGQYLTINTSLNSKPFNVYSYKGGTEFDDLDIPTVGSAGVWIGPDSSDFRKETRDTVELSKLGEDVLKIKESYEKGLMRLPNVHGVSIGYKNVKGRATMQIAICVHVSRKVPASLLLPSESIPPNIHGVPTDVIEHPPLSPASGPDTKEYRPLHGGSQIQVGDSLGTMGCITNDRTSGKKVVTVLSNQHVLKAKGNEVYQPGDKGTFIGYVERTVLSSRVDGGIATIGSLEFSRYIIDVGWAGGAKVVTLSDILPPGYPVVKRGRTTLLTKGYIKNIHYSGRRTDGWQFADQHYIVAEPGTPRFSDHGDSGSVVANVDPIGPSAFITGLLWGGADNSASASPIQNVLEELRIEISTLGTGLDSFENEIAAPVGWTPDYDAWAGRVVLHLSATQYGAYYAELFRHCEPVVRKMVENRPKPGAIWKINQGQSILGAVMAVMENPRLAMPDQINGVNVGYALEQIRDALVKYGDDELRAGLEALEPFIRSCAGKRWVEILKQQNAEPADRGYAAYPEASRVSYDVTSGPDPAD